MTFFQWDRDKNESNIAKHGYSFDTAKFIWLGYIIEWQDTRKDYGEDRFIAIGEVNGDVLVVVYTWRTPDRRLISARKANHAERQAYYQAIPD
jgi:uncharacterized protein